MLRLLLWLWTSRPPLYATLRSLQTLSPPFFVCSVGVVTTFKFPLFNFSFDILAHQSGGRPGSLAKRVPLGLVLVELPGEALRHVIARHCMPNPVDPEDTEFAREPICNMTACLPLLGLNPHVCPHVPQ
jgi:hypothetical protein